LKIFSEETWRNMLFSLESIWEHAFWSYLDLQPDWDILPVWRWNMLLSTQNDEFVHQDFVPKWSGARATMSAYFYNEVTDLCHTDTAFLHPPPWPGQKGIGGPILGCRKDATNTSLPTNMCLHWTKCGCLWTRIWAGLDSGGWVLLSGTSAEFSSYLDELTSLAKLRWIFEGRSLRFGSCRVDIAAGKRIQTPPQPN